MENRKPLKVLVTAGGTRVKIDAIRSIVNGSSGRFGTEIAKAFDRILREHKDYCKDRIIFLGTRSCDISFLCDITRFDLFDEYQQHIDDILNTEKPDIVVLAAAVSDFAPKEDSQGKISSNGEVTLTLKPLPKLISTVREKVPNAVICGFKCLDHASDQDLIEAAKNQIEKCDVDLVIVNNWNTMSDDDHKIGIVWNWPVFDEDRYVTHWWSRDRFDLSSKVVEACLDMYVKKSKENSYVNKKN
jgi:phosphopantothenoylcysteine decarboxylase/phosphopantothenate--cysteine ligase